MAYKYEDLFSVIVVVSVLPTGILVQNAPERRLIHQITNLRSDLTYALYDISTLYKSVESINKTLLSKDCENSVTRSKDVDEDGITGDGKLSDGFGYAEIKALIEAFASEKLLNRQLQNQLNDVKNGLESERLAIRRVEEKLEIVERNANLFKPEGLQNQQLEARIKAIEAAARQNNEAIRHLKNLAESNAKIKASVEQFNKQHQDELAEMKKDISKIQKEVVDNVTTIIETSDCQCKQTTPGTTIPSEEQREIITTTEVQTPQSCEGLPTGVHDIILNSLQSANTVYCENDVDGGGWIVILRRQDGSVDFDRNWEDYKKGFGDIDGEFWIGNDFIHELTKFKPRELRIDMINYDGFESFAKYGIFKVGSEEEKYVLRVDGYSGTAGDYLVGMDYDDYDGQTHDGMRFTTIDADNDYNMDGNCADSFRGGWWFNDCYMSHLTADYSYIMWNSYGEDYERLMFVEMKLR